MVNGGWVCLLAPLAGFLVILLAGPRITRRQAGIISTASVFVGFAGAVVALVDAWRRSPDDRTELTTAWTWLEAGQFQVGLELLIDPLSIVMMLVVTGIGGLIVLYSNGYMAGDDEERRYFAYMSFFVFSMLLLVESGNLLLLLVGWGLVGLASYLLIGFHHERASAVAAAKKAFVMNAVGDAVMALAFFLTISQIGSLDYGTVFAAVDDGRLSDTAVTLLALGLLGGAVAKSAQIPLHTWLPDAMEGPTPVSALIHAATMVTAGVYLICRTHPVFEARARRAAPRRAPRAGDAPRRGRRRARPVGHQARDRVLDDEPDRLHVRRRGHRGVRVRDVPPRHPRVLQGAPLPRRRARHPSPGRRAGHPQDGRAGAGRCRTRTRPS